jgi:hypothetical protein
MGVQEFGCPWLDSVATSWRDSPAPYGPLFLILAGWVVGLAGGSLAGVVAGLRIIALAGVALTALALPVLARRSGRDAARAVWLVLACPLVLVHLVSGAHNDALMIGLIVSGLALAASASRPQEGVAPPAVPAPVLLMVAGGLVLGLAVAVKATAVVVLPFAVLAAAAPGHRGSPVPLRALWRPALAIGGGALLATAALSLVSGRGFGWVAGLARSGDSVTWGSPSTAVGLTVDFIVRLAGGGSGAVPVTRALGIVLLAVILAVLWWRARSGGALPGAGLALAATVLCAPVFHPWYATWPLAVLAATGTRLDGAEREDRWLIGLCAFAATLTLPAGYNWALYTRIPGALVVTGALIALSVVLVRRRRDRKVFA